MLTPTAAATSSVAPLVETLRRLEQAHGPSCAEWSEELSELALDTRAHELGFELRVLLASARACELVLVTGPSDVGCTLRVASGPSRPVDGRDFDARQLGDLELLAAAGAPIAFVARASDLRWSTLADVGAAGDAVAAYARLALDCARSGPQHNACAGEAIARAAQLAVELGSGSAAFAVLCDALTSLLELARAGDDALLLQRVVEAHERIGLGDPEVLVALAMERAEREVAAQRDHRACELYRIAERCLARSTRPAEAGVLSAVRASVLAHAARRHKAQGAPAWISISFLHLALAELGAAPTAPDFSAALQREIAELSGSLAPPAEGGATTSRIARAMHATASRLDQIAPRSRVLFVGSIAAEPDPSRPLVGYDFERLSGLCAQVDQPSARLASAGEPYPANGTWPAFARVFAGSVLEVIRRRLAVEPAATRIALARLLEDNTLVTSERASVYQRGLLACIEGDAMLGLSLLVPQLANSLNSSGAAGALAPGLRLAADLLFDARGEWALREKLAHGTLAPHEYSQEAANLVLWLALRALRSHARVTRTRSRALAATIPGE